MSFDFDTPIERLGTDSQKWQKYGSKDILPMWVADMDFRSSPAIIEALRKRVDHGIFGYARPTASTTNAVVEALKNRYHWEIDPSWLVWLPGLVCGLTVSTLAFTDPGDEILTLTPVYPPFLGAPKSQGRVSVAVPLQLVSGKWEIDWTGLEKAVTPKTKVFFFCHPQNPIARVWRKDEVARVAEFCARRKLILVSDEIHCDLILEPGKHPHVPSALAGAGGQVATLMAPSKAYNVPGLGTSFAVIADPALRQRLVKSMAFIVAEVTTLGYAACEAAYKGSEDWHRDLLAYLRGNRDYLVDFLAREIPKIRIEAPVEATYLAWMNVAGLGLENPHAHFEANGIGLSDGAPFGVPAGRYLRINFGCTRATLKEGLRRMKAAT